MRKMLESGSHATIAEIATAEKINASYVGRVLAADPAISATKYIAVSLGVGTETFGRESDGVPAPRACGST